MVPRLARGAGRVTPGRLPGPHHLGDGPGPHLGRHYFLAGWNAAASVAALLEQAVASGELGRDGVLKALESMGTVSAGGWGTYQYGPVATREPPRANTIFRVNPAAPFGLEVEARNVEQPAAVTCRFTAR